MNPPELNWAQLLLIFTPMTLPQVSCGQSTTGIKDMMFDQCMWRSSHCPWVEAKPSQVPGRTSMVLPYTHLCYLVSSGRATVCICWSLCLSDRLHNQANISQAIFSNFTSVTVGNLGVSVRREGKWGWSLRLQVKYVRLLLDHYRWDNKLHSILS